MRNEEDKTYVARVNMSEVCLLINVFGRIQVLLFNTHNKMGCQMS
jgi:hypothetical protein